jgi:acyl-coenzyme A thioesterase PaaI-like protein
MTASAPDPEHFRRLERLYATAPVTQWFGTRLVVGNGEAEVRLSVRPDFFHAAHAVHGSVYFRMLDDAAFYAAN